MCQDVANLKKPSAIRKTIWIHFVFFCRIEILWTQDGGFGVSTAKSRSNHQRYSRDDIVRWYATTWTHHSAYQQTVSTNCKCFFLPVTLETGIKALGLVRKHRIIKFIEESPQNAAPNMNRCHVWLTRRYRSCKKPTCSAEVGRNEKKLTNFGENVAKAGRNEKSGLQFFTYIGFSLLKLVPVQMKASNFHAEKERCWGILWCHWHWCPRTSGKLKLKDLTPRTQTIDHHRLQNRGASML